jgi:DNA repair exonuclease SbcCD ATPase subunit
VNLLELTIKNVPPFKSATLDLAYKGVTLIRGLNKDAGPKATNAAGKSALIGSLAELVLDESPSGKNEKVKPTKGKKVKTPKQSISVKLEKGGDKYQITKKMGKGKDYEILKNEKTLNIRKVSYTQERIKGIFGISSDTQFYTRVYLDSNMPHPLITGQGRTGRQDYIVELCDLDNIDTIRKLLNAELTAVVKKGVELRTLQTSMAGLKDDLIPKEKRVSMKARLDELMAIQSKLAHEIQTGQAVGELLSFERSHKGLIADLASMTTLAELPDAFKRTKFKVSQLKEQRESASDWRTYDRLVRLYEKAREPASSAMAAAECDEQDVKSGCEEYRETSAELRQLERAVQDPGPKPKEVAEPKYERDVCVAKLAVLQTELKHAKELKSGVCPTCGSKVKARPLSEVEAEVDKWSRRRSQTDLWRRYTEQKTEWTSKHRAASEFSEKQAKLQKRLKRTAKYLKLAELLESVPPKPRKPSTPRPAEFDEKKLEVLTKKLAVLQQGKDLLETLMECANLTDKQRSKASDTSKQVEKLNDINAEVSKLTSDLAQQSEILRRYKAYKERAVILVEECKDEKILKALVAAHSTSGLKRYMVERYSKLLEQQINKYRKIFFSEDYLFEFRYDTKLSLLVHRKYNKRVSTSDVRKLSGAEKRLFTLLLFVATCTMMQKDKRPNILILDEPEANMGPSFVDQLIKCLPLILKLVPHIIFVTPQSNLHIPDSRVFTVVKHHGVATLTQENKKEKT